MPARRLLVPLAALALAAACRSSGGREGSGPSPGASAGAATAGGRFLAEVVDADGPHATLTLRTLSASGAGASSSIRRLPVTGEAKGQLSSLKSGDEVVVGCEEPAGASAPGSSAPSSSGPGGGDMGVGASGGESLSACSSVVSVTRVSGEGER